MILAQDLRAVSNFIILIKSVKLLVHSEVLNSIQLQEKKLLVTLSNFTFVLVKGILIINVIYHCFK